MRAFENFLRFEKVLVLRLHISLLDQRSYVYLFRKMFRRYFYILYSYLLISSFRDWVRGRRGWVSGGGVYSRYGVVSTRLRMHIVECSNAQFDRENVC